MEIKARLNEYGKMEDELADEEERLARLEARITSTTKSADGMPGSGSGGDKMSSYVAQKEEARVRRDELMQKSISRRQQMESAITRLEYPMQKDIIRMRYIERMEWSDIAKAKFGKRRDFGYNQFKYMDKIYKTHGKALMRIKEIMEADV